MKSLLQDAGAKFNPARHETAIPPYLLETLGHTGSLTAADQLLHSQVMTPQEATGRQLGPPIAPAFPLSPTDRRDVVAWAKIGLQALIRARTAEADDVPFAQMSTCAERKLPLLLAGQPLLKGPFRPASELELAVCKDETYSLACIINAKSASGRWILASADNTWTDAAAQMVPRLALRQLPQ